MGWSVSYWRGPVFRISLRTVVLVLVALALPAALLSAQARAGAGEPPPSIADKTEGMTRIDGFMPLYWDEAAGKLWMEVARWDTDVLHVTGFGAGLGSNDLGLDRGALAGSRAVRFQRIGPKVLMIQPNYRFRASSTNPAEVQAVTDAFAPSTLWSFAVAAETGDRVLVDVTDFLVRDYGNLSRRMRPGTYRLDAGRSAIYMPMTMGFPENTEMEVSLTYVAQPGGGGGGGFGGGDADGFQGVGDVASTGEAATVRMHHSFVQLPALDEFTPRAYDSRAGFGSHTYQDYSAPLSESMTQRWIRRHRLEKRNPNAAMSEPVEPIVYYLDPGAPEPIRTALLEGARWWNQAFEAAGFIDAFRVEMRPTDVSSFDIRYNVINWVHRSTRGWSTGGSVTDPRTGEILKGVVTLGSLRWRQDYLIAEGLLAPYATGDEVPPELAEWALARIRQLSAHEVGHTLGLGHNYYNSTAGRISVMDYPHPWVTLENGQLDISDVYDVDIGEWDKATITYGYSVFPEGADEPAELDRILNEAWDEDVRYLSNQDVSTNARSDQWANGTDMAAELTRMMDVRRFALDRFGLEAIRNGAPIATLEEVLVPLYMSHRYQAQSTASTVGGLDYIYAFRGDGRTPVEPVSASEQREAIRALIRTLQPSELTVPEAALSMIPPRPPGWGRTRELFPRHTGSAFDAIAPATVAADHTVAQILQPARAARLVQQHAIDPNLPGLGDVISQLLTVGESQSGDSPYEAEVRRAVRRVVVDRLMQLGAGAPMPQVRAVATAHLAAAQVRAAAMAPKDAGTAADPDAASWQLLAMDIERFMNRPAEPYSTPSTANAPPGAPIGQDGPDYLSITDWWNQAGPSGMANGAAWLDQVAPFCSVDGATW